MNNNMSSSCSYQVDDAEAGSSINNYPLYPIGDNIVESDSSSSKRWSLSGKILSLIALLLMSLFGIAAVLDTDIAQWSRLTTFSKTKIFISPKSSSYNIYVNVTFDGYDQPDSLGSLPWDFLSEPYKTQSISVTEVELDGAAADFSSSEVTWTIDGGELTTLPVISCLIIRSLFAYANYCHPCTPEPFALLME